MNRIALITLFLLAFALNLSAADRLRVMVETDAGGDPDDEQSMVRFLLSANEWDVAGLIATRPVAREGENKNIERTGLGIVRRMLDAYAECHPNLILHDRRYPSPNQLRAKTVPGYGDQNAGVRLIIEAVDSDDPRPLWFMNWGTDHGSAPSSLKQALDQVRRERGPEGYARFKSRIFLTSSDKFEPHTLEVEPPFPFWIDTFRPPIENRRWYHRFSAITAKAGGFDLMRDVLTGHGPLGALYPTNTTHWQKEGDSMTFLYLIPTGMNDPLQPGWGSWAGRYGPQDDARGRPYYWANHADAWNGSTHRDNTLLRWAAHLQNDFRARLAWCVSPYDKANHKPLAVLNGDRSGKILRIQAAAGTTIQLTAAESTDPDQHQLAFHWINYPEAGTYRQPVTLTSDRTETVRINIPPDAAGQTIHLILTIEDNGTPPLVAYRRAILEVD
jgi:hypothetical protein